MDLSLYSTKTLVEMHPNHPVEVRTQMEQTSDENWSPNLEEPVWYCTSSRSHTTISKHAEYQAETIRDYMKTSVNFTLFLLPIFFFNLKYFHLFLMCLVPFPILKIYFIFPD